MNPLLCFDEYEFFFSSSKIYFNIVSIIYTYTLIYNIGESILSWLFKAWLLSGWVKCESSFLWFALILVLFFANRLLFFRSS